MTPPKATPTTTTTTPPTTTTTPPTTVTTTTPSTTTMVTTTTITTTTTTTTTDSSTPPVPPDPSGSVTYTVGSTDTLAKPAAPTAAATMTLQQLANNGGRITGPAVIRGGSWSGGQITISGSDVTLVGITFTSQVNDLIRITGTAKNIRISGNTFTSAGGGADASNSGIIKLDPDPSVTDNATSQRVPITRNVLIDANTVTNPRNAFVWLNHGNRGVRISHNKISGDAWRGDGETEVLKFGWNDGGTDTGAENVLDFNTITGFAGARPYVSGWKQSDWLVVANQFPRRIEIRSANRIRLIGNVWADGDLHIGGDGHTVKSNYIRTVVDRDSFGPTSVYMTNGFHVYTGQPPNAPFYITMTNSAWKQNTIVNDAGSNGYGIVLFHSQYGDTQARPSGNAFVENLFVTRTTSGIGTGVGLRVNNDSASLDQVISQNTWTGNTMFGVTTGRPPGTVLPSDPGTPVPTTVILSSGDLPKQ